VWTDLPELLVDPLIAFPRREGGLSFVINARTTNGEPIIGGVRDGEVHTITPRHGIEDKTGTQRLFSAVNETIRRDKVHVRDAGVAAAIEPTTPLPRTQHPGPDVLSDALVGEHNRIRR